MKRSLPDIPASYDHHNCDQKVTRSHLIGIPYRLKDPPRILYHVYIAETRTYFLQINDEKISLTNND